MTVYDHIALYSVHNPAAIKRQDKRRSMKWRPAQPYKSCAQMQRERYAAMKGLSLA